MMLEGLLIVIVIILTVSILTNKSTATAPSKVRTWDCIDRASGDVTAVRMQYSGATAHGGSCKCPKCSNPEKESLKENAEYFTQCQGEVETKHAMSCMCDGDDKFAYAVDEFGGPGMEFKDWVTSQSVDPQVIKNHAEFVQDRIGTNSQNVTGRTYSPDSHESYDPIPWVGLRRPQAVEVCNPTQVADVNYDLYDTKPKFTWSSS